MSCSRGRLGVQDGTCVGLARPPSQGFGQHRMSAGPRAAGPSASHGDVWVLTDSSGSAAGMLEAEALPAVCKGAVDLHTRSVKSTRSYPAGKHRPLLPCACTLDARRSGRDTDTPRHPGCDPTCTKCPERACPQTDGISVVPGARETGGDHQCLGGGGFLQWPW